MGIATSLFSPTQSQPMKTQFCLVLGTTELELEAESPESCVQWQHALHAAIKDVFSIQLSKFYQYNATQGSQSSTTDNVTQNSTTMRPTLSASPMNGVGTQAYSGPSPPYPDPGFASEQPKRNSQGNPYAMCMLSKIVVNPVLQEDEKIASELFNQGKRIEDPRARLSAQRMKTFECDFTLEKTILESSER